MTERAPRVPGHDELLAELGLLPSWRLRDRPGLGRAPSPPIERAPSAGDSRASAIQRRTVEVEPAGERPVHLYRAGEPAPPSLREARIAALEWSEFAADVDACTACKLSATRHRSVPGVGDRSAQWLFVGE